MFEQRRRREVFRRKQFYEKAMEVVAEAVIQILTRANEELFEKIKEDEDMASALMELMKPEVEKYAEDQIKNYEKKRGIDQAKIMIQHGADNEYIKLITDLSDKEIDALREHDCE